jgi:hypothetical protein
LSVFVILILLTLLIVSYLRLDVNRTPVKPIEYWSVDVLFSIYLAWVSVATIANISAWLFSVNWNGFGIPAQTWAVIMLAVASLLGLGMALTRRDIGYLSVLVWAFIGIAVKQTSAPLVVLSAWLAAAAMLGFILYRGIYLRAPISSLRFKTKSP